MFRDPFAAQRESAAKSHGFPREGMMLRRWGDMADPERFERPTPRFVVWCSIQLSYGSAVGRHVSPAVGQRKRVSALF